MKTIYDPEFSKVAVSCQREEPDDAELKDMLDDVIYQLFGSDGLKALVKPGDHVVIKTNIVCCNQGARGEKGLGVITDPRIVRYVAEKVREIIGYDNNSSLKVVDALFSSDPDPSAFNNPVSFHYARLNRVPDNAVQEEDITYDYNGNGILDGTSNAQLINLDAMDGSGRDLHWVSLNNGRTVPVAFPRFLRKRPLTDDGEDWTDVLIGIPVFKNHGFIGCTGALKLHYGFRDLRAWYGDSGRRGHSGMFSDRCDGTVSMEGRNKLCDYITAQHMVRTYDVVIMDCLTANLRGPCSPTGAVSITPDPHEKVDYIKTHAIMASCDPVALDTVESTLGGYSFESIILPKTASENNVGIQDPAKILVDGMEKFCRHRAFLENTYKAIGKYPLSGCGDPEIAEHILPEYTVTMDGYTLYPDAEGLHHVKYTVHPKDDSVIPDIRRVDLVIAGKVRQSIVGDDLMSGEFVFRHQDYDDYGGAYVAGLISVWDSMFNCVNSSTEFFIPPDGCKDLVY